MVADYDALQGTDLGDYVTPEVIVSITPGCAAGLATIETSLDDPAVIFLEQIDGVWTIESMWAGD